MDVLGRATASGVRSEGINGARVDRARSPSAGQGRRREGGTRDTTEMSEKRTQAQAEATSGGGRPCAVAWQLPAVWTPDHVIVIECV